MKTSQYYKSKYNKFIEERRDSTLEGFIEIHHIKPRCLGGTNDNFNLIKLTPREHFIAHLLLYKSYPDNIKLVQALSAMACGNQQNSNRRNLTSRDYQIIKEAITKKVPEKSILEQMYFTENKSFKKIAKHFSVSDMTVCKWFKLYQITPKQASQYHTYPVPSKKELIFLLKTKTGVEIAKHYNVSRSLAYKWLQKCNISPVQVIGITKNKPTKEELYDLYVNKQFTREEILKYYPYASKQLISKWLKSYNIKVRRGNNNPNTNYAKGTRNPRYGKPGTMLNKKLKPLQIEKMSYKIQTPEGIFISSRAAADFFNISQQTVINRCNNINFKDWTILEKGSRFIN